MKVERLGIIGVIVAALLLTVFAFAQQQQGANNEATAIASARTAGTLQAEADAMRSTAVANVDIAGTAQVLAQQVQGTAVAQANDQATGQALAQEGESTAVALADFAMTAQAQAEATRAAAVETAQAGATEAINQALTATIAMGSAQQQAAVAETLASNLEQSQALLATQVALSDQSAATARAAQEQVVVMGATATAQSEAISDAIAQIEDFFAQTLVASPLAADLSPEDTVRFLVEEGVVPFYTGRVTARMDETTIDLKAEDDMILWEEFPGQYTNFVVATDMQSYADAAEDRCGIIFRKQDDDNFYLIESDRQPEFYFEILINNSWDSGIPLSQKDTLPINSNGTNRLVIVAIQNSFTLYVNGELVAEYSDNQLARGTVGVSATTFDKSDEAGCTFTNSWLWQLPDMSVTPTPLPSPTAITVNIPNLTETFVTGDQTFLFRYPRGWFVRENDQGRVLFYNQLEGTINNVFPPGQIGGASGILRNPGGVLDAETALQLLTSGMGVLAGEDAPPLVFSDPMPFTLGAYEAVRTAATGKDFDIVAMVYPQDDVYIVMLGLCAPGELALCEPILRAIAANAEYMPDFTTQS